MFQLVYLSHAAHPMSDEELDEILLSSHRNNPCKDVTGLLLFAHNTFFQILEGPRHKVEELYDSLHEDDRHFGPQTLYSGEPDGRMFQNWAMGFERIDEDNREFAFLLDLSKRALEGKVNGADADLLLQKLGEFAHKIKIEEQVYH